MKLPDMTAVADKAAKRRATAIAIVGHAVTAGLDANLPMVLRNYHLWLEWHQGRYATGYLVRKTGVRRIDATTIRQDVGRESPTS